jgi:integration host factor subunit beta
MTRSDLITRISEIYPYMHVRNVERVVSIIIDSIINTLKRGGRIELRGFGSFSIRKRKRSEGRNPRTGERVMVQEKKVPFFKAGRQLKDMINGRAINERS